MTEMLRDTLCDEGMVSPFEIRIDEIELVRKCFLFDSDWYLRRYPDVAALGFDAAQHYCATGWRLGYAPGPLFDPCRIKAPPHRNPLVYALQNLTLCSTTCVPDDDGLPRAPRTCPEPSFETSGSGNATHIGPGAVLYPGDPAKPCRFDGSLAVHLHLFHMDMLVDFRRRLDTIPVPFDLFVSVTHAADIIAVEAAFADIEYVARIVAATFPNVGRDIGPMIAGFGRRLAPYDLVVHMHSKKSDHTPAKRDWGLQLAHHLFASRGHAISLLDLFADDARLGLAFPVYHASIQRQIRWGANFLTCRRLMARMGAPLDEADLVPFPAGSFFAIRGEVLRPLLAGELTFSEFDPEEGQIDGTLAHAIERFCAILCRHVGYDIRQIRAARPAVLGSMVLDDEPYRSCRLDAFRTAIAPRLPSGDPPAGLHVTLFSGGQSATPLPYEHLLAGARYMFFGGACPESETRQGQWTLHSMPVGATGDWIVPTLRQLTDTDIAIWVSPDIAVVDDISDHIAAVVAAKAAIGAFPHPRRCSLGTELRRIDARHPSSDVMALARRLLPIEQADRHALLDPGLVIFDLRHASTAELLSDWQAATQEMAGLTIKGHLALTMACARQDTPIAMLSANGAALQADPRVRHFGMAREPHPYRDVMPRLAEFAQSRQCSPTSAQRTAMMLPVDILLLIDPADSPDAVAQTLHNLGSLYDPRCRCVLAWTEGANLAIDAIVRDHLSRHPRDRRNAPPPNDLQSELVLLLTPGMRIAPDAIQTLAEAALARSDAAVFTPTPLVDAGDARKIWIERPAAATRRMAAATLDIGGGYLPAAVRTTEARVLLARGNAIATRVSEAIAESPSVFVPAALAIVPPAIERHLLPQAVQNHLRHLDAHDRPVVPCVSPIAFYLPQFHPFAVNDRLWGAGFSEWRNVVRAKPRFSGHHQPRLPGDLGYYDLRTVETLRAQGRLADLHGLHGMAVYYYRFGEHRLMHEPTDILLRTPDIPLRFFYCWANEDWTRAWDGRSDEVNLKQDYSPRTLSLILDDVVRACTDPRYIRVDGRPVFMIYQINKLPHAELMLEGLRAGVRDRLGIEICLGTTYNDQFRPEWEELVDFIAQFPPHRTPRKGGRALLDAGEVSGEIDRSREDFFEAYASVQSQSLGAVDSFDRLQPGVCPDWDNASRREQRAHILIGATPEQFGAWTRRAALATMAKQAIGQTRTPFLFVNAWNEWAEGAVLEPYENDGRTALTAFSNSLPWASMTRRAFDR